MSPAPAHPLTEHLYQLLPEHYRLADGAGQLRAYLSLVGDQAGLVDDVAAAVAAGQLTDPLAADAAWLGWLAQLVGIDPDGLGTGYAGTWAQLVADFASWGALEATYGTWSLASQHGASVPGAGVAEADLRAAVADASLSWLSGSRGSYRRALEPYLTGQRRVLLTAHQGGDPWALLIETYAGETPVPAMVEAVVARYPHAAGLAVTYQVRLGGSWADVGAQYPTWGTVTAAHATWGALTTWMP